jgi:tetratricopeptide (TPR) repeat protein
LLPVIGLIQAGGAALANRYTYISTIGLLIAAVWTLAEWAASNPTARRKEAGVLALAVAVGCVVLTLATLPLWRDTETLFRQTTRNTQSNAIAHLVLSEALLEKKKPQEALEEVSKAILLTPKDAKLHLQAGRACLDLNQPELAIEALQNAWKFNPKLDGVGFQLARAFRRVGRNDEAKALLLQHLEKHPRDGNAWNNLGGIQAEQRDVAGAEKSFQNALAKEPGSFEPRRNLIRLLAVSGRSKEAMAQIQTGLKYHPDHPDLWFQLGLFQEEAGQIEQARNSFEKASELNPGWPLPKESLVWLLIQQPQLHTKDARKSVTLLKELLHLYGEEVPLRVAELQACTAAANGRFVEAVEMAEKVRDAFQKKGDQRGMARIDAQIAAFNAKQRWLPPPKK